MIFLRPRLRKPARAGVLLVLRLLLVCAPFAAGAQTITNLTYHFADYTQQPVNVSSVMLTALGPADDYNGALLTLRPIIHTRATRSSITNGFDTFTNVISGYWYSIAFSDAYGVTTRTNFFPYNTNGYSSLNGVDWIAFPVGGQPGQRGVRAAFLYPTNLTTTISNTLTYLLPSFGSNFNGGTFDYNALTNTPNLTIYQTTNQVLTNNVFRTDIAARVAQTDFNGATNGLNGNALARELAGAVSATNYANQVTNGLNFATHPEVGVSSNGVFGQLVATNNALLTLIAAGGSPNPTNNLQTAVTGQIAAATNALNFATHPEVGTASNGVLGQVIATNTLIRSDLTAQIVSTHTDATNRTETTNVITLGLINLRVLQTDFNGATNGLNGNALAREQVVAVSGTNYTTGATNDLATSMSMALSLRASGLTNLIAANTNIAEFAHFAYKPLNGGNLPKFYYMIDSFGNFSGQNLSPAGSLQQTNIQTDWYGFTNGNVAFPINGSAIPDLISGTNVVALAASALAQAKAVSATNYANQVTNGLNFATHPEVGVSSNGVFGQLVATNNALLTLIAAGGSTNPTNNLQTAVTGQISAATNAVSVAANNALTNLVGVTSNALMLRIDTTNLVNLSFSNAIPNLNGIGTNPVLLTAKFIGVTNVSVYGFINGNGNLVLEAGSNILMTLGNLSVVGGNGNTASSLYSFIGGGQTNTSSGQWSTIAGGQNNSSGSQWTFIGGGQGNSINSSSIYGTIAGGLFNSISFSPYAFIGSGRSNSIFSENFEFIGAGQNNHIGLQNHSAVIDGGENNLIELQSHKSTIAGGFGNIIYDVSPHSFIGAGSFNTISNNAQDSAILGNNNLVGINANNSLAIGSQNQTLAQHSISFGTFSFTAYSNTFIWGGGFYSGITNNTGTNDEFAVFPKNGMVVNTNNSGTNALRVGGWVDAIGYSIRNQSIMDILSQSNTASATSIVNATNNLQTAVTAQISAATNAAVSGLENSMQLTNLFVGAIRVMTVTNTVISSRGAGSTDMNRSFFGGPILFTNVDGGSYSNNGSAFIARGIDSTLLYSINGPLPSTNGSLIGGSFPIPSVQFGFNQHLNGDRLEGSLFETSTNLQALFNDVGIAQLNATNVIAATVASAKTNSSATNIFGAALTEVTNIANSLNAAVNSTIINQVLNAKTNAGVKVTGNLGLTYTNGITMNGVVFVSYDITNDNLFLGQAAGGIFNYQNGMGSPPTGGGIQPFFPSSVSGQDNLGIGFGAGQDIGIGRENYFIGIQAAWQVHVGSFNVVYGSTSMGNGNESSSNNVVYGDESGAFSDAQGTILIGGFGQQNDTGSYTNIVIGNAAANNWNANEYFNIIIGDNQGIGGEHNTIHFGTDGEQTNTFISGQIHGNGSGLTNLNPNAVFSSGVVTLLGSNVVVNLSNASPATLSLSLSTNANGSIWASLSNSAPSINQTNTLGTAAFQPISAFATSSSLSAVTNNGNIVFTNSPFDMKYLVGLTLSGRSALATNSIYFGDTGMTNEVFAGNARNSYSYGLDGVLRFFNTFLAQTIQTSGNYNNQGGTINFGTSGSTALAQANGGHTYTFTAVGGASLVSSNANFATEFSPTNTAPMVVTQISSTTTITNTAGRGMWFFSLVFTDAVTGQPSATIRRPGLWTNTVSPAFTSVAGVATNFYCLPVNPNTTNSITDTSGTGASTAVIDSHLEQ